MLIETRMMTERPCWPCVFIVGWWGEGEMSTNKEHANYYITSIAKFTYSTLQHR
jgi:hypothetical protein